MTPPRAAADAVRVLLADDQPLIRASLDMIIADTPDLTVVGEAGTGAEAVRMAAELRPGPTSPGCSPSWTPGTACSW